MEKLEHNLQVTTHTDYQSARERAYEWSRRAHGAEARTREELAELARHEGSMAVEAALSERVEAELDGISASLGQVRARIEEI